MWKQGVLRSPFPNRPGLMLLLSLVKLGQVPCVFYAFATMPMSLVYAAVFAMPLATNAMNAIFLGESIGPRRITAICVGFVGVLIALNPTSIEFGLGHLALIALPLLGAAGGVVVRKTAPHEPLSLMGFWPNLLVILAMGGLASQDFRPMPLETVLILMGTAACAWTAGMLYMHAMRRGPVISASSMQYSQVIWGGMLGYFLFDEAVTKMTFIGSTVIIAAGLYIMFRSEAVDPSPKPESVPHKDITARA
jgi:S-adenosylmethionine uptake transporter